MPTRAQAPAVPRITYLRIKNYRALRDVVFHNLTPLTVLIGPNGSGKSTVLDALDFLAEAVRGNLTQAWEKRNRFSGMRTQGSTDSISFEVDVFISEKVPRLKYKLSVDEADGIVFISDESLEEPGAEFERIIYLDGCEEFPLRNQGYEHVFRTNIYRRDGNPTKVFTQTSSQPIIFSTLAFAEYREADAPKTLAIAKAIASFRYIHFTEDPTMGYSDEGPRERLSANGDNLPNVLYYLSIKYPEILDKITAQIRLRVPSISDIFTEITSDERLLLRFKDVSSQKPFPARYMSGGIWKLVVFFTLLYEPEATGILGIEEPENELHPFLLYRITEELGKATEYRQLLVTTHSPFLLDGIEPEQVWILDRKADGYTHATRTADIPHVKQMVEDGSPLGYLWTSKFFSIGDPLAPRNEASNAR